MKWKLRGGGYAPNIAVSTAEKAAKEYEVPVGILLGTVECESGFRLGLVSSAGAVGPCQFLPGYAQDYYRYAGFEFDLEGWESITGMAAVYAYYAELGRKRYGYEGADGWRYALLSHRYGQNSRRAKELDCSVDRIQDVEAMMRANGLWYSSTSDENEREDESMLDPKDFPKVAKKAAEWALDKVGCKYSQAQRDEDDIFDCSSLVARAYAAQGISWEGIGNGVLPNSSQEVYSDNFLLLWPEDYDDIGKKLGGASVIGKAKQAGDLQFLCTDSDTSRSNRITHVTMVTDRNTIVHARSTKYGVRTDDIDLYAGKVCALLRFDPSAPLRKGMRGPRVKALQEELIAQGADIEADGIFGPATEKAADRYGVG